MIHGCKRRFRQGVMMALLWCAGAVLPTFAASAAVDVNTATEAALTEVRGIGPAMARRIVEARAQGGAFRDVDDLADRVPGVGPRSAANLQAAGLTFGKTGAAEKAAKAAGGAKPPKGATPVAGDKR
ncbi:ComEA family DNA-binding protein [Cupriavidus plantarum]|uniref:ComEA family DNA-binding protein n=1 Tax=Cupriavidus plantarum TaxID=942865 RepID=UPI00339D5F69